MTELKPCPFCGAEAKITLFLGRNAICCTNCDAAMFGNYKEKDTIIIEWNRRESERKYIKKLDRYLMHEAQMESGYASTDYKDYEKIAKMMMGEKDDT